MAIAFLEKRLIAPIVDDSRAMELSLTRLDYVQANSCSHINTLKALPFGKHKHQNVVIGDDSGQVMAFGMKRGEKKIVFTSVVDNKEVTHLCLGGGKDGKEDDKVFVATDCDVHGITRKGKSFFQFNSNMTEPIKSLQVLKNEIWTSGEYVFSVHKDTGEEVSFYPCQDRINDFAVGKITGKENESILGCADGSVRVIKGNECVVEANVRHGVTALEVLQQDSADGEKSALSGTDIVFGTRRGNLGSIKVHHDGKAKKNFSVDRDKRYGAINCIKHWDITKDGTEDFLVGREDGHLQVYSHDGMGSTPTLQFTDSVTESIRSMDTGVVSTPGFDEIILCTFSGRVVSFTSEVMSDKAEGDKYGRSKAAVTKDAIMKGLNSDLKDLKSQVDKESKQMQKELHLKDSDDVFRSIEQQFKVAHTFDLSLEEAAYRLCVESPTTIDEIILRSDVPMDLLDVEDSEAIVSVTNLATANDRENGLLASFRSQEPRRRMEIKIRTVEGQSGELQVYVVATPEPKTAQMIRVTVHPLSLHSRIEAPKASRSALTRNRLELSGFSSLNQVNEWLRQALPDFPRRLGTDFSPLYYENSLTTSLLAIEYESEVRVILSSDSISTVSIVKEAINQLAMKNNVRINISIKVDDTSVVRFLKMIEPKLQYQLGLANRVRWLDGLNEITSGQGGSDFLSPVLSETLSNEKKIREDFKASIRVINFWYGVITDLYIDLNRCKGQNVSHNIPFLMQALNNFNMERILSFFGVDGYEGMQRGDESVGTHHK